MVNFNNFLNLYHNVGEVYASGMEKLVRDSNVPVLSHSFPSYQRTVFHLPDGTSYKLAPHITQADVLGDEDKARKVLSTVGDREIRLGLTHPISDNSPWGHYTGSGHAEDLSEEQLQKLKAERRLVTPAFYGSWENPATGRKNQVGAPHQIHRLAELAFFTQNNPHLSEEHADLKKAASALQTDLAGWLSGRNEGAVEAFDTLATTYAPYANTYKRLVPVSAGEDKSIPSIPSSRKLALPDEEGNKRIILIGPYQRSLTPKNNHVSETLSDTATAQKTNADPSHSPGGASISSLLKNTGQLAETAPIKPVDIEEVTKLAATKTGGFGNTPDSNIQKNLKKSFTDYYKGGADFIESYLGKHPTDFDKRTEIVCELSRMPQIYEWDENNMLAGLNLDYIKNHSFSNNTERMQLVKRVSHLKAMSESQSIAPLLRGIKKLPPNIIQLGEKLNKATTQKAVDEASENLIAACRQFLENTP